MPIETIQLRACAKLNLALAVGLAVPEGPDQGMHPISSWMHAIDLCDSIALDRLEPGSQSGYDITRADGSPVDWPVEADLVVLAHRALEQSAGPLPAKITVVKHIPDGGGLGGGSSDAASVLRGLVRLFRLDIDPEELLRIGHSIGSDVPFFLDMDAKPGDHPRAALVTGLGDHIERLEPRAWHPDLAWILICPPFGCPTGEVYRAFDARPVRGQVRHKQVDRLARSPGFDPGTLFNDLAAPAQAVRPRLHEIRSGLSDRIGRPVHVSGSGSTLFALVPFAAVDETRRAARSIEPGAIVIDVKPTYLHHTQ